MNYQKMETISISTRVQAPIEKVWEFWTKPAHIVNWNFASDDWCCPHATNDLAPQKKFSWRMESEDGKIRFDFEGIYDQIDEHQLIRYHLEDGRNVEIQFIQKEDEIEMRENFETEDQHTAEQQRAGWQAILENFKKYVESRN